MSSTEKSALGQRMKEYYEARSRSYLTRRSNVIIRIDGCHFHTFTRGLRKPYDEIFIKTMQLTCKDLCENIQGCKIGYVESDEISLLITDYDTLQTAAWFDYQVQKICSVAASMAAMYFNKRWAEQVKDFYKHNVEDNWREDDDERYYNNVLTKKVELGGYFDARCFNIPKEEVTNYFIWRQNDATRNSIQGLAQANFSQKQIQGLNNSQLQDKLMLEKNINWNDCKTVEKRGTCVIHTWDEKLNRSRWEIDEDIPIFSQNRDYIEHVLPVAGEQ